MKLPPIKELKLTIQPDPQKETVWYAKTVIRKISIYLTWVLLHTPLTANQTTIIQAILGIGGSFILAFGGRDWAILALIIIQLGYTFDCVDGEIARFRQKPTANGIFLDALNHAVVIPLIFLGLTIYSFNLLNEVWILYFGVILVLISGDPIKKGMLSALFYLLERKEDPKYQSQNLVPQAGVYQEAEKTNMKNGYYLGQKTIAQQLYNWIKALSEYPASMNIITLTILTDLLIAKFTTWIIYPLPVILTVSYTIFLIGKEGYFFFQIYTKKRIERKFFTLLK